MLGQYDGEDMRIIIIIIKYRVSLVHTVVNMLELSPTLESMHIVPERFLRLQTWGKMFINYLSAKAQNLTNSSDREHKASITTLVSRHRD